MNTSCFKKCAYKDCCNLDLEKTADCKVYADSQAQDFKSSTIMGIKTDDLLAMQYKKAKK